MSLAAVEVGAMAGRAKIKQEYIVQNVINKEAVVKEDAGAEDPSAPPPPKKKRRGQNKNRPQTKRSDIEDRLCPSLVFDEGTCTYGEKCRFMHDVKKYMDRKPEDIGPECYAYAMHGKCNFRFACRYASAHLVKNEEGEFENDVNETRMVTSPPPKIANTLPRDFLLTLRKRKHKFVRAEAVLQGFGLKDNKPSGGAKSFSSECDKSEAPNGTSDTTLSAPTIARPQPADEKSLTPAIGTATDSDLIKLRSNEKKTIKFNNLLYLAPLTTLGNLPFRVTCKGFGADVTCGEMTMATSLLQGNISEWALLKRHPCEDIFGVQMCGGYPDTMAKCSELIDAKCNVDFVDINMGCPIDLVYNKGCGSALMRRTNKLYDIVRSVNSVLNVPLTCKMRAGIESKHNVAHNILPKLRDHGVAMSIVHGRSRQARYTKQADWEYIEMCAKAAAPMALFGNGDVLSYEDYNLALSRENIAGVMIARGALIKPWIFTEIKEQRHWDISSSERMDVLRKFVNTGLLHWGSDSRGVETTRRFLLEWLSFLHRYIPVGVLEQSPQKINEQPPQYVGRDDLETLMASHNCQSWVKISEMLLGKVPDGFQFLPKHKANSYN